MHRAFSQRRRQRGDALVESLIAIVLLGVIGLGLVFALGRTLVAQKFHKGQSLAVQGIRAELQSAGVASGCPVTGSASQTSDLVLSPAQTLSGVTKSCTITPVTVSVNGVLKNTQLPLVSYAVQSDTLLGPGTLMVSN
nr:type II secretion system protein [uncultured Roseateles sp.]